MVNVSHWQQLRRYSGNGSAVLCYCCVSDARGQQHAAHRVPRRPASSSLLCIDFFPPPFLSLFYILDTSLKVRMRASTDAEMRRVHAECKKKKKNKQTSKRPAFNAPRKQETRALRLTQLADASLVTRQVVRGPFTLATSVRLRGSGSRHR